MRCSHVVTAASPRKLSGLAIGRDESVLYGVGRLVGIAQRAQGDRPHAVSMSLDYFTEGVRIPGDVPGQQIGVGHDGPRCLLLRRWRGLGWGIHKESPAIPVRGEHHYVIDGATKSSHDLQKPG